MAIGCFNQLEGLFELAKPALEALTPRSLKRQLYGPKVVDSTVVPATVVCRAKGDGVPAGLLCRVSVQGELLMLGCHRTGKLGGVRMLKNAEVVITSPGCLEITAPNQPLLTLRFDTIQQAEYWAAQLRGAAQVLQTPRGPYSARGNYSARGPYSSRGSRPGSKISPWMPGVDTGISFFPQGRKSSKESLGSVATSQRNRQSRHSRPYKARQCSEDSTKESSEDNSSLEEWVEAQTERSSKLMQLFEKEERLLNATADELRDRRLLIESESRCIDDLEAQEASQQEGLSKLQSMVDTLSSRYRKAKSAEGPQYFYIGDSEVETDPPRKTASLSLSPTFRGSKRPMVPKLDLSTCRARIQRAVQRAEDAMEQHRKVVQHQAGAQAARQPPLETVAQEEGERPEEAVVQEPMLESAPVEEVMESMESRRSSVVLSESEEGSWNRMIPPEEDVDVAADNQAQIEADPSQQVDEAELANTNEESQPKPSVWRNSKNFPRSGSTLSEAESAGRLEPVNWIIPEPVPEDPVEDTELQLALQKRLRQVESSHCEFTKEGQSSHADVSWRASAVDAAVGVFTHEGRSSNADVPRDA